MAEEENKVIFKLPSQSPQQRTREYVRHHPDVSASNQAPQERDGDPSNTSQDLICHPQHILEDEGLTKVARMVQALTETAAQGPL
ncbi:UNVERIFIED_CONTAM: hypothetical protein FKN15_056947 [Acipenser sinensis]